MITANTIICGSKKSGWTSRPTVPRDLWPSASRLDADYLIVRTTGQIATESGCLRYARFSADSGHIAATPTRRKNPSSGYSAALDMQRSIQAAARVKRRAAFSFVPSVRGLPMIGHGLVSLPPGLRPQSEGRQVAFEIQVDAIRSVMGHKTARRSIQKYSGACSRPSVVVTRRLRSNRGVSMIVPYIPVIFAMIIMLAQPVQRDCRRGQVRNGVAIAWSHDMRPPKAPIHCVTGGRGESSKPAASARAAKQVAPDSNEMPRAKFTDLGDAADLTTKTTLQQVAAATAVAEKMTAATGPDSGVRVALLMARPEIKSVSDLTGKAIALDDRQSSFRDNVRAAIAGAGVAEIKLSRGRTKAIDRLIRGEATAAVLTMVSSEAAEGFPEIAGFKILRVPLPPGSLKPRPNTPR